MKINLRKWTIEDKDSLKHLCNIVDRKYLSDRLPSPYTGTDADWWLNMVMQKEGVDGLFRAIIVDDELVGSISVERKEDIYKYDGELGFMLQTDCWNHGIMTEAVRQICEIAFKELHLNRISANVFQPNIASQRVLQKNGFLQEGIMCKAATKSNTVYDVCIFGFIK